MVWVDYGGYKVWVGMDLTVFGLVMCFFAFILIDFVNWISGCD